jgi:CheY-like chemotaxis protein
MYDSVQSQRNFVSRECVGLLMRPTQQCRDLTWKFASMEPDAAAPVALVVEDEGLLRAGIVEELESAGWITLEASKAHEAFSILQDRGTIDLLVTDIRLRGLMDGWDVAEGFRRLKAEIPVVYASGTLPDERRMVPGSVFVAKPFLASELVAVCNKLISRAQP